MFTTLIQKSYTLCSDPETFIFKCFKTKFFSDYSLLETKFFPCLLFSCEILYINTMVNYQCKPKYLYFHLH